MDPSLLKVERKRRGWSQGELAKALGVTVTTVSRWEQGKAIPYPYYRKKLVALFGKTPQQLGLLSEADEQEALLADSGSETASEASLLADPVMAETVDTPESLLSLEKLLKPIKRRLWPRSRLDGLLACISRVPAFRPLHPFSWRPFLTLSTILLAVLLIITALLAFARPPLLREKEKQRSSSPSNTRAQETYGPPEYILTIQNTDPSLNDTTQRLQNVFDAVYAQLVNRFALHPASTANKPVTLTFSSNLSSPVQTSGTTITLNSHWIEQHPTDVGLFTHALTLVVEQYPPGAPAWFSDGMATYARHVYGPADDNWSLPESVQPHESYTQGGPVAARFLLWLEQHTRLDIVDQLNHTLQTRQSFSTVFNRLTRHSVNDLWKQYTVRPDITLTPQQLYKTVTSRKPLYQSSFRLSEQESMDYARGLNLSNFAMQADITIISGNVGAGFFFRNVGQWITGSITRPEICLFASGAYSLRRTDPFSQMFVKPDQSRTFHSAIKVGYKQINRLTIIVQKYSIYLYINAQLITKIDNTRLASSGMLGVLICNGTTSQREEVRFDKVQVF